MPTISGQLDDTQTIDTTDKTWTVAKSTAIHTFSEDAIFVSGNGNTLKVLGAIRADLGSSMGGPAGILSQGTDTTITVAASGFVSGYNGILAYFDGAKIVNHGTIAADSQDSVAGIGVELIVGTGSSVTNDGLISGRIGLYLSGTDWTATNEKGGQIIGYKHAVDLDTTSGDCVFTNAGTVTGMGNDAFAVFGGDGDDHVINKGAIRGLIYLGDGADTFDFRGGSTDSDVAGGEGDDIFILRKAGATFYEEADDGFDTVRSQVSYTLGDNIEKLVLLGTKNLNGIGSDGENTLTGNAGKNKLNGMGSADTILGGKGADTLTGGEGNDTFGFAKGNGRDTIKDFEDGVDRIAILSFSGIDDTTEIESHIHKHGNDVWVVMSKTDVVILKDTDVSLIDHDDFSLTL